MNNKKLKILNPIMFIAIFTTFVAMLTYKISGFFNYDAYGFKELHEICGFIFVILAIFHIVYNWQWIKSQIFGIKPRKNRVAVSPISLREIKAELQRAPTTI